jgi:hypothetical protein
LVAVAIASGANGRSSSANGGASAAIAINVRTMIYMNSTLGNELKGNIADVLKMYFEDLREIVRMKC